MGKRSKEIEEPEAKKPKVEESEDNDKTDYSDATARTVYCGGIPYVETEASIKKWFEEWCGEIECLELLTFPGTEDFRGIVLATFKTYEGAEAALACHHTEWNGQYLVVKKYDPKMRKGGKEKYKENAAANMPAAPEVNQDGPFVAYIGNLDWEVDDNALWEWVKEHVSRRTKLVSVRLTETETRKFGFAEFGTADQLQAAVAAMNQKDFWGRPAKVMIAATKKKERVVEDKPESDRCSLIVRKLPEGTATITTISRLFSGHKLVDVYVPREAKTFGFVRFESAEAAKAALVVSGAKVDGQVIEVIVAMKGRNPPKKKERA